MTHIVDMSRRVLTPDHPECYCATDDDALRVAEQRLPRPSLIELHSVHARTGRSQWTPWRGVP